MNHIYFSSSTFKPDSPPNFSQEPKLFAAARKFKTSFVNVANDKVSLEMTLDAKIDEGGTVKKQ